MRSFILVVVLVRVSRTRGLRLEAAQACGLHIILAIFRWRSEDLPANAPIPQLDAIDAAAFGAERNMPHLAVPLHTLRRASEPMTEIDSSIDGVILHCVEMDE